MVVPGMQQSDRHGESLNGRSEIMDRCGLCSGDVGVWGPVLV